MPPRIPVAVFGVSGYTGAEALRLLASHPVFEVVAAGGSTTAGERIADLHPHLPSLAHLTVERLDPGRIGAEAALLALPHEESAEVAPALLDAGIRVVDLSGAFRLSPEAYPAWYGFVHPAPEWAEKAVYGLPELHASEVAGADLVANPGCFPTAAILALAPLLRAELISRMGVVVDAKSGISGAGRTATQAVHYASSEGSVRPYKPGGVHRHVPEMEAELAAAAGAPVAVSFVPHLVPTVRGILATCYAPLAASGRNARLHATLAEAYADAPFVRVLDPGTLPDTKRTTGANAIEIGVAIDQHTGTAVVMAAIDNLVKGAAGQAVQNLNLMHGLPEAAGLEAAAVYP